MKVVIKNIVLVLFVVQLFSCAGVYEDVSNLKEYAHLIDTEYTMTNDMIMISNLSDSQDKQSIYSYSVTPKPGYAGRYVAKHTLLKLGTLIKIKKVIRCTNCPFEAGQPDLKVEIPSLKLNNNFPIKFRGRFDGKLAIIKNQQGKNIINPKLLKKVKN